MNTYRLVTHTDPEAFSQEMTRLNNEGYWLSGALVCTPDKDGIRFSQLMWKREADEKPTATASP